VPDGAEVFTRRIYGRNPEVDAAPPIGAVSAPSRSASRRDNTAVTEQATLPPAPRRASGVGVLLAAGAGRRMGGPKALLRDRSGQAWVVRAARALLDGGCRGLVVVVGAAADEVTSVLHQAFPENPQLLVVVAPQWSEGMGASLRRGLDALADDRRAATADAVLVALVDTPEVDAAVVRRLLAHATPSVLARAAYHSGPGHPVLIGRDHWDGARAAATGDRGARDYLAPREVILVDCSDLGTGVDLDRPQDVARFSGRSTSPRHTPG